MIIRFHSLTVLLLLLFACSAWGQNDLKAVEKSLRMMKGKYLVLRTGYLESNLTFDSTGNLAGKGSPAPVSLNGVFQVKSVKLAPRWIELEGDRAALYLDRRSQQVQGVKTGERIKVKVQSGMDLSSLTQAETLLGAVFHDASYLASLQSNYWRSLATGAKEFEEAKSNGQPIGMILGERPVYAVQLGLVEPPKPTFTPDPEYSEDARQRKISGRSIWTLYLNELGQPEIIEISAGLEKSLDLKTVDALRKWRFKPATRNGSPVASKINVEVNFMLY